MKNVLAGIGAAIANRLDGAQFGNYRIVRKSVRAGFDAAERGGILSDHWQGANLLDATSEANPAVLKIIRARVRHEFNNNSYCRGICNTVANYVIGTGPKLRLIPRGIASKDQRKILYSYANLFNDWFWEIDGARKCRVACVAKIKDGEGWGLLTNRKAGDVRLNFKPFECDFVTHNDMTRESGLPDGIEFDEDGEVKSYMILPRHPGNTSWFTFSDKPREVAAQNVIQWFDETRPGLCRGIPEIAAGLKMFAQLGRYTSAVVNSAETAAEISAVLKTQSPPATGIGKIAANSVFELEHNAVLTLPGGWEIQQLNPTQPGANHDQFIRTIIREIGRCVGTPYAVAAADASGHNYSSMRGDWQGFFEEIKVRRGDFEVQGLEKIRRAFDKEARLVFPSYRRLPDYDFYWDWPGYEHVDPEKVARAQEIRLKNRTTTLAIEWAKEGRFYEDEIEQIRYEQDLTEDLNVVQPAGQTPNGGQQNPVSQEKGDEDGGKE